MIFTLIATLGRKYHFLFKCKFTLNAFSTRVELWLKVRSVNCTCLQARWGWACAEQWRLCWQNWYDLSRAHWQQSVGELHHGEMSLEGPASPLCQLPLHPRTSSSSCSSWCGRRLATATKDESCWKNWFVLQSPSPRCHSRRHLQRGERCHRTRSGLQEAVCVAWQMSSSVQQLLMSLLEKPSRRIGSCWACAENAWQQRMLMLRFQGVHKCYLPDESEDLVRLGL